jgi:hypothetical protein
MKRCRSTGSGIVIQKIAQPRKLSGLGVCDRKRSKSSRTKGAFYRPWWDSRHWRHFSQRPNPFGAGLLPASQPLKRIHEMADGLLGKEIIEKKEEVQLDIFTHF